MRRAHLSRLGFGWLLLILSTSQLHSASTRFSPCEMMPLASRGIVLGLSMAGDRVVAVGERGHVLLSDDNGRSWRQVPTPTRATLTAVTFPSPLHGWAVGHHNTLLATRDGGETWTHQDHGGDPLDSFLDVYFLNTQTGFVMGAYGMAYRTDDSGETWTQIEPVADQLHANAISAGPDGSLYLAVEMGLLLRSGNDGADWEELPSPYDGSFFGVLPLTSKILLAFGLRGHVFRSVDQGVNWKEIPTPVDVLILDAVRSANGPIVLAGQSGQFLISWDSGNSFELWPQPDVYGASALVALPDGGILAASLNGLHRLSLPLPSRSGN